MNRTATVESVGVSRNPAHGVHGHRPSDHLFMMSARPVRPGHVKRNLVLESHVCDLCGNSPDRFRLDTRYPGGVNRRIAFLEITLRHHLKDRDTIGAINFVITVQCRYNIRQQCIDRLLLLLIPGQRISVVITNKQSILGMAGLKTYKPRRVRVAHEKVEIDTLCPE